MKKIFYSAAAVVCAALMMAGCVARAPKADFQTADDTLSYTLGAANTNGLKMYLASDQMQVDTTMMADFLRGVLDGARSASAKEKAYLAGLQIGQQIANNMYPGVNRQISGNDSTEVLTLENILAGFCDGVNEDVKIYESVEEAGMALRQLMQDAQDRQLDKLYGENRRAGEEYMAKVAKEEGVQELSDGIYYRVDVEGDGTVPELTDRVKVHYEGTLIDGTVFDSSIKRGEPTEFRCNQVISGWTKALTHMPVGSEWTVYIPQEQAYGPREAGLIPPFSALTFKIKLIDIIEED